MKKKAYIITFSYAINFGAVIQNYALVKIIESFGIGTETINYCPRFMKRSFIIIRKPYHVMKRMINKINFHLFRKAHLNLTGKKYSSPGELAQKLPPADYYISGSDQIWNHKIMGEINPAYYLDFVPQGKIKIAYAASMGPSTVDIAQGSDIARLLANFDHLSVREQHTANQLNDFTEKPFVQVLDPTFVWNDYASITRLPKKKLQGNIVVYCVSRYNNIGRIINQVKSCTSGKIINISQFYIKEADVNVLNVSPQKWLGFLSSASLVLTNSFHGIALSIKLHKDFRVIPFPHHETGTDSRTEEILQITDLSTRLITDNSKDFILSEKIDYKKVDERLKPFINQSTAFLKESMA